MKKIVKYGIIVLAALASGCAKDDMLRTEGLTMGAGNALAANSAMQIIDPWPEGVENPDLVVPSDRGETTPSGEISPAPAAPSTTNP